MRWRRRKSPTAHHPASRRTRRRAEAQAAKPTDVARDHDKGHRLSRKKRRRLEAAAAADDQQPHAVRKSAAVDEASRAAARRKQCRKINLLNAMAAGAASKT